MMRFLCLFLTVFVSGSMCRPQAESRKEGLPWDESRVRAALEVLAQEPHPIGSVRQAQLADWLQAEAQKIGLTTSVETFVAAVPDPALLDASSSSLMQKLTVDREGRNIQAKLVVPGSDCVVLLASHYDSKRLDSGPHVGANDSGSSSAALLEIMRQLKEVKERKCSILAVWFDGEEAWLPEWRDGETRHPAKQQDNLYGSRRLADQLQTCTSQRCLPAHLGGEKIQAMILLDMIGMPQVKLSLDSMSDPVLLSEAVELDRTMFKGALYGQSNSRLATDDHIPFMQKGVPAIDLIDFDNLQTWHQPSDRPETIDYGSIRLVSQLAMALALKRANP